jgi:hypothetical protein
MLCTGLSQEAWFETTKCTYRPVEFRSFLRFAGVAEQVRVIPVMAEKFRLECESEAVAWLARNALERLSFRDAPLMFLTVAGTTVYAGCRIVDSDPSLLAEPVDNGDGVVAFGELFYRITAMNSGRHIREGTLWIRNGAHELIEGPIPLAAIAPTILAYLRVAAPKTMRNDLILLGTPALPR